MNALAIAASVGALAGLAAYHVFPEVGLISALIVMASTGWFMWRFSSMDRIFGTLGALTNPMIGAFAGFCGSFVYFSFNGYPGSSKFLVSIGVAMLGSVTSILLMTYWTIGD